MYETRRFFKRGVNVWQLRFNGNPIATRHKLRDIIYIKTYLEEGLDVEESA